MNVEDHWDEDQSILNQLREIIIEAEKKENARRMAILLLQIFLIVAGAVGFIVALVMFF